MTQQQQGALRAAALEALYEACSYAELAAHDLAGPMERHNARDMYDEAKRAIEALAALAGEHEPAAPALTDEQIARALNAAGADPAFMRLSPDSLRRLAVSLAAAAIERPAQPEPAVTEAMVSAYLAANAAYWQKVDTELPGKPGVWRNGTPREATRESLVAALSTPAPGEQPANPSEGPEHG